MWFDTHLHLYGEDIPAALFMRARTQGVHRFNIIGTDLASSRAALEVARETEGAVASVGVHPHEAESSVDIDRFRPLLADASAVAVGEIGLDYHYEYASRSAQQRVFAAFLELSAETGKPAVVHCRDAYEDCLTILRDVVVPEQRIEIHSYTGTPHWVEKALALNAFFSVNGIVTFKKADNVRESLGAIPLDRLLLETDAPYLAPVPVRGKRNEPAYLPHIGRRVASLKGVDVEMLATTTTQNALSFFGSDTEQSS